MTRVPAGKPRVFLTVDVEHGGSAWIRSHPETRIEPATFDCHVPGPGGGAGKALGLPFILATLREYGLKATFFVEPLHVHYFGKGPLAAAMEAILRAGMDAQLHAHPAWLRFADGRARPDSLHAFPAAEQEEILGQAKALLEEQGARVRAFRAGGFAADNATYAALRGLGIPISSSYNLAYLGRECRIDVPGPRNDAFPVEGCLEVPLTNYRVRDPRRGLGYALKHFQVGNTPARRARHALEAARELGMRSVTVLLHNFEFVRRDREDWFRGPFREHARLTAGFRELCAYLADAGDRFETAVFGEADAEAWGLAGAAGTEACPLPKVPGIHLPL